MLGVVLAGGASRRMGRDKASVLVGDRPMIDWVNDALRSVCARVLTFGGPGGLADHPGGGGPLAGLAAALALGEPLLAVALDQPWVREETLARLADVGETAVPIDQGMRQVTCGCYFPNLALEAANETEAGGSIQSLLDRTRPLEITEGVWRTWGEDGRSWFSVDRPSDLTLGFERYGAPGHPPM
ncbi:MAG: molybdenum cofactor guanylyltransferase [Actinomycetota bacterium]